MKRNLNPVALPASVAKNAIVSTHAPEACGVPSAKYVAISVDQDLASKRVGEDRIIRIVRRERPGLACRIGAQWLSERRPGTSVTDHRVTHDGGPSDNQVVRRELGLDGGLKRAVVLLPGTGSWIGMDPVNRRSGSAGDLPLRRNNFWFLTALGHEAGAQPHRPNLRCHADYAMSCVGSPCEPRSRLTRSCIICANVLLRSGFLTNQETATVTVWS